jgi:hypothetical protein
MGALSFDLFKKRRLHSSCAGAGHLPACHSSGSWNPVLAFEEQGFHSSCGGAGHLREQSFHSSCGGAGHLREKSFHSSCGGAGHFSLLAQRKVTKRNAPRLPRPSGILPCGCARGLRGSQTAHPCTDCERTRIVRAPAARPFLRPRAAANGGPGSSAHSMCAEAGAGAQARAQAQARTQARAGAVTGNPPQSIALASAHMECALLPGPVRARRAHGGKVAQRSRAQCARVRSQHTDVLSANPVVRSRSRRAGCPQTAPGGCPFFGLLFFGQAKKSDPLGRRPSGSIALASNPLLRRRSGSPAFQEQKQRKNWIPASVGMTSESRNRIPACAEITSRAQTANSGNRWTDEQKTKTKREHSPCVG